MGVFIDYVLYAECTEAELIHRLERVRQRCMDLPLRSVGSVLKVEAIHNPVIFKFIEDSGHSIPPAVAERLQAARTAPLHGDLCLSFSILNGEHLSAEQQERYFAPARLLMESSALWNPDDLPEEVTSPPIGKFVSYRVGRGGIALEYANVMLRCGYLLVIDPGEGCERMRLGFSTYDPPGETQMWYGDAFVKTQYAKDFIQVHETVCRVLDSVQEQGLLLSGSDTCGYYATRTWEEAGKNVNEELLFAKIGSGLIDLAVGNLREEGVQVQTLVDNASNAKPVDFSSVLKPPAE